MYGQLGRDCGDANTSVTPQLVDALDGVFVRQVAAGSYHSCVVDSNGTLYIWGGGHHGQLGLGKAGELVSCLSLLPSF